jgi:hypothetical protein
MSQIDSWYRKISTGRHFQNGHHNIAQIQHFSISTKFHMLVDYDVRNWFPTLWNFYRSPFSKWPPQCRKKSSSEFVTMQSVHLNLLSVAGLGDFIIVRLKSYLVLWNISSWMFAYFWNIHYAWFCLRLKQLAKMGTETDYIKITANPESLH